MFRETELHELYVVVTTYFDINKFVQTRCQEKEKIFLINCIRTHKHTYTHAWQDYFQNDVLNILRIGTKCFR